MTCFGLRMSAWKKALVTVNPCVRLINKRLRRFANAPRRCNSARTCRCSIEVWFAVSCKSVSFVLNTSIPSAGIRAMWAASPWFQRRTSSLRSIGARQVSRFSGGSRTRLIAKDSKSPGFRRVQTRGNASLSIMRTAFLMTALLNFSGSSPKRETSGNNNASARKASSSRLERSTARSNSWTGMKGV